MSGFGTRPTAAPVPVDANRQALAQALLGLPARVGQSFQNMANAGLLANEAFLQGRGTDGEDMLARPFLPSTDTGGRLGALASFLNSNMALGGPAGSLGAGISTEGRGTTAANVVARAANVAPMDEAHRIAQMNAAKPVSQGGLGLPPNNTAADRAAAMGNTTPGFHYMPEPMRGVGFDPARVAKNDYGTIGQGVYIDPSPGASYSNAMATFLPTESGGNIIPVLVRTGNMMDASELPAIYSAERSRAVTEGLKNRGVDSVMSVVDGVPNELMVIDPRNIRSRFAAFDPARRNEADLLASYGPNPLAGALLGYQPQE